MDASALPCYLNEKYFFCTKNVSNKENGAFTLMFTEIKKGVGCKEFIVRATDDFFSSGISE